MPLSLFRSPLGIVACLVPLVVVFTKKPMPVFLIVVLCGVVLLSRPWSLRIWWPLAAAIAAFLLWCLLSSLWSIDATHSLMRFVRLSLTVAGGAVLCALAAGRDAANRADVLRCFAIGMAVASAIAILAYFAPAFLPDGAVATYIDLMPLLSYGAFATISVFILVAGMAEFRVAPLPLAAIVLAVAAVAIAGNGTSKLALVVGVVVGILVFWLGRRAAVAMAVIVPLLFVSSPVLVQTADIPAVARSHGWKLDHSLGHRLVVWRYVYGKIHERPALGWGLHTSRILPDREHKVVGDPAYADILEVTGIQPNAHIELMPVHPHNASLQTWLELGVVGMLLYGALYGLILYAMSRIVAARVSLAASAGAASAVILMAQLSFSAWQSWWLSAQFLAAAFLLFTVRKTERPVLQFGKAQPDNP